MTRKLLTSLLALLALALARPALAAPNHIAAELVAERTSVRPGDTVMLAFSMKPERGWHGYWLNPGDAGLGLTPTWRLPPGARTGELQYPVPQTLLVAGLMNHVYEDDYAVLVPLTVPADARPGSRLSIAVDAEWLACTDTLCVPERDSLATSIAVGQAGPPDRRFDEWRRRLPAGMAEVSNYAATPSVLRLAIPLPASAPLPRPHLFLADDGLVDYAAPQRFSRRGDLLIVELRRAKGGGAAPSGAMEGVLSFGRGSAGGGLALRAEPGRVAAAGEPLATAGEPDSAPTKLAALLGLALVGGLLLNVMPCVFPILSLKALALAGARQDRSRVRRDGLAYTAGVLLACIALGVIMLLLRAAGEEVGWAFQLQEPLVVAALLLLALAITANFAGVFELPSLWGASGERGAFATGLLAAFVATPCTGPFMAAAMGAALVLPPLAAVAVFAALGLGLALPFLLLALVPALRHALPRPGPWMATFRRAMAVPMGLTALALLWLAARTAGVGFAVAAGLVGVVLLAVLAMIGRDQHRGQVAARRGSPALAAVLVAAIAILPLSRGAPLAAADELGSAPFSAQALARAQEERRPVFVYFTADWCLTCKVNENAVIAREPTRRAFAAADVQVLRGDWTRRDPQMTRFLVRHGAGGVPLYLWYRPGAEAPEVLPQILTSALLIQLSAKAAQEG